MSQFTATYNAELKALSDARVWLANDIRGAWTDETLRIFERKFREPGTAYGDMFADEIARFIHCRQHAVRKMLKI